MRYFLPSKDLSLRIKKRKADQKVNEKPKRKATVKRNSDQASVNKWECKNDELQIQRKVPNQRFKKLQENKRLENPW
jgi:hypothetical protein